MVLATMLGSAAALFSSRATLTSASASRAAGSGGGGDTAAAATSSRLFFRGIASSSGFVRSPLLQLAVKSGRRLGSPNRSNADATSYYRRSSSAGDFYAGRGRDSRVELVASSVAPLAGGAAYNSILRRSHSSSSDYYSPRDERQHGSAFRSRRRMDNNNNNPAVVSMSSMFSSWSESGAGGSGQQPGAVDSDDDGRGWEYVDDPSVSMRYGEVDGGGGGDGDGGGEVFREDVFESEDESEWMVGADVDPQAEKIFFGEKVSFSELGLGDALCNHLETLGLPHSTAIQAAAVPGILKGEDLVIGAETGSGKTLAYLLPIVERLLRGLALSEELPDELLGNARGWAMFPDVVVLVPNKELCEQVLRVLNGILGALEAAGNTDITAGTMYGSSYEYPYSPSKPAPSILICTPSFLRKYTNMKVIPLFCKATTLVMDEADMLMEGSYKKELDDILIAFRRADRVVLRDETAGTSRGIKKTQYVLAAATLPTYGLKSVDQYIKRAFPDARKIQQDLMHRHHPAIQQEFVEIGGQVYEKINAVIDLLRESGAETTRTMVFTNTAATCQRACAALAEEGLSVVPYHKDIVPLERMQNLQALRSGRANILVCTDLAARGIDVPSVTHIIQMEMATNVVHHLHRLGRAARAGRRGKATTFYDDSTRDLVNSIRDAGEGSRLDGSFSRQRGFRKKFKKYGPTRTFQGETWRGRQGKTRMSADGERPRGRHTYASAEARGGGRREWEGVKRGDM